MKQINGTHETDISECGEAGLQINFKNCKKNPGHFNFTPMKTFQMGNLPAGHQNKELYDFIKTAASLTVRIAVNTSSSQRPKFWPYTEDPYPFYNTANMQQIRTGSGELHVFRYELGKGYSSNGNRSQQVNGRKFQRKNKTCPCEKCRHLENPKYIWWEIFVVTATHVVFDDSEARNTSCKLFFDREDSPLVKLDKWRIDYANVDKDRCVLKYITCDPIGARLYDLAVNRWELWTKVFSRYSERSDNKLTFIISHPHGCTKHISFGEWVASLKISEVNDHFDLTKLVYTTRTCSGSSGARVYRFTGADHIHTGALSPGLNYSGPCYYRK